MQPSALLAIDRLDKVKRTITFVADAGAPYEASLKALQGSSIFAEGSSVPIGQVTAVERPASLQRSFVTVKIADAVAWTKAKANVWRAAQAKLYGDKIGSLNLIDAPFEDTQVLRKAAGSPRTEEPAASRLRRALVDAGAPARATSASQDDRALAPASAILASALSKATAQLGTVAKAAPPRFVLTDEWLAEQGVKRAADGFLDFDPDLCRLRRDRLGGAARLAAMNPNRETGQ